MSEPPAMMLKITEDQLQKLAQPVRDTFVARMRPLLRGHFPGPTAAMSDDEVSQAIDAGITRAAGHGIHRACDVERYIYLMFILGFDFDRALPWASDILERTEWSGQMRVDLLCAAHDGRLHDGPDDSPFFP